MLRCLRMLVMTSDLGYGTALDMRTASCLEVVSAVRKEILAKKTSILD